MFIYKILWYTINSLIEKQSKQGINGGKKYEKDVYFRIVIGYAFGS